MNGHQGTVKTWIQDRRYGFIKPDASGPDVFVHFSGLVGCEALPLGALVEFDIGTHNGKPCAENVSVLS